MPDSVYRKENRGALAVAVLVTFFLLVGYPITGSVIGICSFTPGNESLSLLVEYVLFTIAVHLILVLPLTAYAYGQLDGQSSRTLRILVITILLSLPLLSFGYFRGGVRDLLDAFDLALVIVPAVAISTLLYDDGRKVWLFTLYLSTAAFIPLFWVNDFVGSFHVVRHYISSHDNFYVLRTVMPLVGLFAALIIFRKRSQRSTSSVETLRNFGYGLVALVVFTLTVKYILPVAVALKVGGPVSDYIAWDFWWIANAVVAYLLFRPGKMAYFVGVGVCAVQSLLILVRLVVYAQSGGVGFFQLTWLINSLLTLFICTWFLFVLFLNDSRRPIGGALRGGRPLQ